ncbi:MAG: NUDIX domain-containing protein [Caldimonas sp.]
MDWLVAARQAAEQTPASTRVPLRAWRSADHLVEIGSIEPLLAERLHGAGLPLIRVAGGWTVVAPADGSLDASLDAIARWLHHEGECRHWRDERLAVADPAGIVVGAVERAAVRALGIATVAVHLVGLAPDGRVWVQRRSATKSTDPGLWDTLMGGQVAAGESVQATLERETIEEAGLQIATLQDLERRPGLTVRRPVAEGYMVERIEVFRAVVPEGRVPENRDGEVDAFDCLAESALREGLAAGAFTLEASLILGAELERPVLGETPRQGGSGSGRPETLC